MKITAKSNSKGLLSAGQHLVTIKSIKEAFAKANDAYADRTPQLEVRFESDKGFITHWYNLKGFKKDENDNFVLDADNNRIEDEKNTMEALGILSRLALHAGIPENTECDMKDLIDMKVGINVKESNGSVKVAFTIPVEKLATAPVATETEE